MPELEPRLLPRHDFSPLALAVDDLLTADIQLVVAYRYEIGADRCAEALAAGLGSFPHLTGTCEPGGAWPRKIVPLERETVLELVVTSGGLQIGDLEALALDEHSKRFIPRSEDSPEAPLFRARLTFMKDAGISILGLRVSHMAVDGTGLAWFVSHCTAALRGVEAEPVFHERHFGFGNCIDAPRNPPERYRLADEVSLDIDSTDLTTPVVFTLRSEIVRQQMNAGSLLDARLRLGAWLCMETAALNPAFTGVGLWCDPRGTNGIPIGYTGNSGCYMHFPLEKAMPEGLTRQLREMATRSGFQRIAETHRRIKRAECEGRPMVWDGPGTDILQLNLVPHAVAGSDFGGGIPEFGLLLSRNSSGLRISLTPDGSRFLIEACLPDGVGEALVDACRSHGLLPSVWCTGRNLLECG